MSITENKAVETLEYIKTFDGMDFGATKIALKMAIQVIEEIQEYRAIGTVEDLKTMKENGAFSGAELAQILAMQMELKKYQSIGTIEEFKVLKEKSVAKKIVTKGQGYEADCYCPNCNTFLGSDQDWCFNQTKHCSECGQALET